MNFVEILVSFVILSFILVGIHTMQFVALKQTKATYYFNVAINQANVLRERLKNTNDLPLILINWNKQNQDVLPNGRGLITHYPDFSMISICWGRQSASCNTCSKNTIGLSGCYILKNPRQE